MNVHRLCASGALAVFLVATAPIAVASHGMSYELSNAFDVTTSFRIVVLDEEKNAIPEDHWRTDVENDVIALAPGGERRWLLQLRYSGKYLAFTRRIGTGLVTNVCAAVNRPF